MPIHSFDRMWISSASCAAASGVLAIVEVAGPVSITDQLNGPNAYASQLNMISSDGYQIQALLNFYSGGLQEFTMEAPQQPGAPITDQNAAYIFQLPLNQAPTSRPLIPFSAGGGWLLAILGSSLMLWPMLNGTLQGTPIYQTLPFSRQIQSASLDLVAVGGGSKAIFAAGAAFNVQLKLEGISDATYAGIDWEVGGNVYTPPILCGTSTGLNTLENCNLTEDLTLFDAETGFYEMLYHV